MNELLIVVSEVILIGLVGIVVLYVFSNIGSHDLTYASGEMKIDPFCQANGYSYGQPYQSNKSYMPDNVICYMNTSQDQSSFRTYHIWNTMRTTEEMDQ